MKFTLLLFGLAQLLKIASHLNKAFKHAVRKAQVRILITTRDRERARLFTFDRGKVSSCGGFHNDYDAALVFKNAGIGFKVLTSSKADASFNAAADGGLCIRGMSFYAKWFQDVTQLIR
ncbi:MAG TPA: hypothetical protein DHV36_18740 [Desulfobacteraceae bacterium]|nr:hypothetical protein [Desulfobacteraceae bacterium]